MDNLIILIYGIGIFLNGIAAGVNFQREHYKMSAFNASAGIAFIICVVASS